MTSLRYEMLIPRQLISQLNSLTMQMQMMQQARPPQSSVMPMGISVPLYQPQPMPYPPHSHLGYYHPHSYPYAGGSPMHAPLTPPTLLSPTHSHPFMAAPSLSHPTNPLGHPTSPSEASGHSSRGNSRSSSRVHHSTSSTPDVGENEATDEPPISQSLMEAIFKRPESYAASQGSRSGSNRSNRSLSASLSPSGSAPVNVSRSPSLSGQLPLEADELSAIPEIPPTAEPDASIPISEDTPTQVLEPQSSEREVDRAVAKEDHHEYEEEDPHTPGQTSILDAASKAPEFIAPIPTTEPFNSQEKVNSSVEVFY
jgi:hypothetical protein